MNWLVAASQYGSRTTAAVLQTRRKASVALRSPASAQLQLDPGVVATPEKIMLGCLTFAGLYKPCSERDAVDCVRAALEAGITTFDTAPHYGLGLSEERLGLGINVTGDDLGSPALHSEGGNEKVSILREAGNIGVWTKSGRIVCSAGSKGAILQAGGHDLTGNNLYEMMQNTSIERDQLLDFSARGAQRSLAASEARLGGYRVRGLRVHDVESHELVDQCLAEDGMLAGLRELRRAGRIDKVSLGMNGQVSHLILRLLREAPDGTFDDIMLAHGWNLLTADGFEVLAECHERGIQVHNAGIYCSGLLAGGDNYFYAPAPEAETKKAREWHDLAAAYDLPLPALAIQFALWPKAVSHAVIGMQNVAEVKDSVKWAATEVPPEVWGSAEQRGLLHPKVAEALLTSTQA